MTCFKVNFSFPVKMIQLRQIELILVITFCCLHGSIQFKANSTNYDEPELINFGETSQTSEKNDSFEQLLVSHYLNLSATLQDMKKEYTKLEQKLDSIELKFDETIQKNHILLKLLVQNALPNLDQKVYYAAKSGNKKFLLALLAAGAPTEYEDSDMNRPIHVAASYCLMETLVPLLAYKADPNARGQNGYTPLHWTLYNKCLAGEEMLLANGADIEGRDDWQYTPLIKSAAYGYSESVKMLLDKGADINAVQEQKNSALHMASKTGRTEVVEILINRGADLNLMNWDEKTALDLATENNRYEIVKLLKSKLKSVRSST